MSWTPPYGHVDAPVTALDGELSVVECGALHAPRSPRWLGRRSVADTRATDAVMEMRTIYDTRGRSRILGVLQLVSLVVLLSGILGVGIHGAVGGLADTVPAASFGFEYDESTQTLEITHQGGDAIDAADIRVAGVDVDCGPAGWGTETVSTGNSCTVLEVPSDAHVRIAWDGVGQNTATLDGWAGPDA